MTRLQVGADVLAEINAMGSFLLAVPPTAHVKGERFLPGTQTPNPKFTATWYEVMQVTESQIVNSETLEDCVEARVRFKVTPDSPQADNVGRVFSIRQFVHVPSLQKGPKSKMKTMTLMSCAKLNKMLRGMGFEVGGSGIDYAEYFGDNSSSPIIGQNVGVTVSHYSRDGREYQDAVDFGVAEG